DLQTAAWRIAEARAQRRSASSAGLPSVSGNAIGGRQRASENGFTSALGGSDSGAGGSGAPAPPPSPYSDLYQVGFDATWELDLWGGVRRSVEAADAGILSAEQARADAAVSLTAEIARTYLDLRGAQRQRAIAQADIADQRRLLALTNSRSSSGFAAQADSVRQASELANALAALPPLEQTIDRDQNALARLLALPPGALASRIGDAPTAAAPLPPEVPVGLPGDLLRRRPDVLKAEADLHAATARIGVARAALFPSVTLGLFGGLQSVHADSLTDWASRFWIGGAQVSIPLFEGGKLKAQVELADAQAREAALTWRKTVLGAYHDANDALYAYVEEQAHETALRQSVDHARRSRDLTENRWRSGFVSQIDVITAERQWHQAQLDALRSSVDTETDLVALYKALGGDWQAASALPAALPDPLPDPSSEAVPGTPASAANS
ncbi:MAG TPA: efflux transporter outer membrane subunit, partial [Burkholderiaceae bacterium]|nr:efflux transporter outer membrane subunit [Burkholderiaceae bacterium]